MYVRRLAMPPTMLSGYFLTFVLYICTVHIFYYKFVGTKLVFRTNYVDT